MKILFVANVAKEHILKFHIPTIKVFKQNGWTVDVACAGKEEIPFCDSQYHTSWKRSPFTFATFKGIIQLKKIINQGKYDVVFCHTPVGGLVSRIAARKARRTGTKVIYCAHGLHFYKGAPLLNWLLFYPVEKFLSYYTDLLLTVNEEDYIFINRKFSSTVNVKLIPEVGVDIKRLKVDNPAEIRLQYRNDLNIPNDAIVLIYVAELIKNKNQGLLIDTLKILEQKKSNIYLVLIGPDHLDGEYQRKAKDLGLFDKLRFLGWRNDIGELMYTSDIYVASSLREGFGINLVEAMYCGLPIVATKNRGHETVIRHNVNGFIAESNSEEELSYYIEMLLDDPKLSSAMSSSDVSRYDADSIAKQIYKIIVD